MLLTLIQAKRVYAFPEEKVVDFIGELKGYQVKERLSISPFPLHSFLDDYLPQYGNFFRPRDSTLQKYQDYLPRYGDYLKREKERLQVYQDYVPDYGGFYKWDGRRWQKYENYLPDYGDCLEGD